MDAYQRERNLKVCGIGFCATTMDQLVDAVFTLPTEPVSATVDLVGVPGIISAKESEKVAETYSSSTMAIIDGMPIVKIAWKRGIECDRCAAPDIMPHIFAESVKQGKTHYFYGTDMFADSLDDAIAYLDSKKNQDLKQKTKSQKSKKKKKK